MPSRINAKLLQLLSCCMSLYAFDSAYASETLQNKTFLQKSVLQDFVKRMRLGYARAGAFLENTGIEDNRIDLRGLPDGEILILAVRLKDATDLEGSIFAEIQNRQIYLSLNDLFSLLSFPIKYNPETRIYSGWYIRENRLFSMDIDAALVVANGQEYKVFERDMIQKGDDIYVTLQSAQVWFGLELKPDIGSQLVHLDADPPLPIMERIARRKLKKRNESEKPVTLPRGDDEYDLISFPQIDVSTRTNYRRPESGESETNRFLNIRTAGEFAYGTLATSLSANDEDQLTNVRATYLQESANPELLGDLKARRFEVGDVQPTRIPIIGNAPPETGIRITNADLLSRQNLPSTQISGYIFPGWDVELYRDNSLLAFAETDDSGFYSFDNIRLFSNLNSFRVVAYGPQGEVREETLSVPFDQNREAEDGNIYDVSLSVQNRNFYDKFDSIDPDANTLHFAGFLETPLTANTALRLGARHRSENNANKTYASAGISTSYDGTLFNATVATDEQAELAAEFVATRQFGSHNFRSDLELATDNFNPGQSDRAVQVFSNRYALEGPFPLKIGDRPRYASSFSYGANSEGNATYSGRLNFNTTYKNFGFNQSLLYNDGTAFANEQFDSETSITGSSGKNSFRGTANYNIRPESNLEGLFASWRRRISPDLESQLEYGYTLEDNISRLSGQLNWRPETVTITPRVRYDNTGNIEATVNTRFGVTRNPDPGEFVFTRDFVTGNGTINVFVFLDKNGDKIFNGEDEPIEDARVLAPQNGGGANTDENGIAFLSALRPNVITDVYVEVGSLEDPFWIPGDKGVSIMPRTGTNARVDIPIHNSGEIDGTIYGRASDGSSAALRNITLHLHNEDGKIEQKTRAGPDGFYLFSLVPPGRYALVVADAGLPEDVRRPRPQFVEVGYDGTTIFGNDIFLEMGKPDIPTAILADLDDYKAYHPHIDFDNNDYKIALNLGQYQSRLLTSFMWYRLKTRYAQILTDTHLYVPPSQSYALPKTGQHALRVGLGSANIDDAYNRCKALVTRGFYCKVEVYPTAGHKKLADASQL